MKIETVKIESLIPYAFNNKKHADKQVNLIANSIRDFGFNQPIVVDEDNVILVGHGRLLAAQKLGLAEVPVLRLVELSDADKRAYRILDNKLAHDAEWDLDSLRVEIDFLKEQDFDLESWGLNEFKFDEEKAPEPSVTDDDYVAPPEMEVFIRRGDGRSASRSPATATSRP